MSPGRGEGDLPGDAAGAPVVERRLGLLVCDVRGFGALSASRPPRDVLAVLNRWFHLAHAAVVRRGGRVDAWLGDGFLARFGDDGSPGAGLAAARTGLDLVAEARAFDPEFRRAFGRPFEIRVGAHVGEALLGTLGAGEARRRTAFGEAVNLAFRVASAGAPPGTSFLVSEALAREAGDALRLGRRHDAVLRGASGAEAVHEVEGPRAAAGR
jgi:adenylate cyclase